MTERIKVFPALGLLLRDEFTLQQIPPEGAEVPLTRLTERRLARKEFLRSDPRPVSEPAPKKSKKDEV